LRAIEQTWEVYRQSAYLVSKLWSSLNNRTIIALVRKNSQTAARQVCLMDICKKKFSPRWIWNNSERNCFDMDTSSACLKLANFSSDIANFSSDRHILRIDIDRYIHIAKMCVVGSWLLVNWTLTGQIKGFMHKLIPGQQVSKLNTAKGTSSYYYIPIICIFWRAAN
jgi:hypothetical protein